MRAIVSLANGRGNYYQGLARLGDSLKGKFNGDFFGFMGEHTVGAPLHGDNPYAFKVYAFERVLAAGYDEILWLDSSVFAIKSVDSIFEKIHNQGYIMQEAGHLVGRWCNDYTLNWFGISRDEANKMLCYGNAGLLGINFKSSIAVEFFNRWKASMLGGCFKGSWEDHRHDLTCGSIVANQMGMVYEKGDEILQYAAQYDCPKNDSIIFYARGL